MKNIKLFEFWRKESESFDFKNKVFTFPAEHFKNLKYHHTNDYVFSDFQVGGDVVLKAKGQAHEMYVKQKQLLDWIKSGYVKVKPS